MDLKIKTRFIEQWRKYFTGSELPIACFYSEDLKGAEFPDAPQPNKQGLTCIFSQLAPVRKGRARAFNQDNLGCWGSKSLLGFTHARDDDHTIDFLVNVEKYKKSPAHVRAMHDDNPPLKAKKKYLVFKRWDTLTENDDPQVVCFFCLPDVLSGLHGLANYDTMTPHGVMAPFCSGCEMLVAFPMKELESDDPRAVIGLLDPSTRICVKPNLLSFSIPWPKFLNMLGNMDDCFLNTYVWEKVHQRLTPAD